MSSYEWALITLGVIAVFGAFWSRPDCSSSRRRVGHNEHSGGRSA